MTYQIELFDSMDSYVKHRVEHVTKKTYDSLEDVMTAIRRAGFMDVPFLQDALQWRS